MVEGLFGRRVGLRPIWDKLGKAMKSKINHDTASSNGGVTPEFLLIAANAASKRAVTHKYSVLATMVAGFASDAVARRVWSFDITAQDGNVRYRVECSGFDELGNTDFEWMRNDQGAVSKAAQSAYKAAFQKAFFGLDKPSDAVWTPCTKAVPIARAIRAEGMTATLENGQLKLSGGKGPVADALRNAKSIAAIGKIVNGHNKALISGEGKEQRIRGKAMSKERSAELEGRADANSRVKTAQPFRKIAGWFTQTNLTTVSRDKTGDPDLAAHCKVPQSITHPVEGPQKLTAEIDRPSISFTRGSGAGYGYSVRIVEKIKNADGGLLGVQFGLACIADDISVAEVAGKLGVTRQTIYGWFLGTVVPREKKAELIRAFLASRQGNPGM